MFQWVKDPACHCCGSGRCCGLGSIPGPRKFCMPQAMPPKKCIGNYIICECDVCFFFFPFFLMAWPAANGNSQAKDQIGDAAGLQQHGI